MYRFALNHRLWNPTCDQFLQALRCISSPDQIKAMRFAYQRDVKAFMAARLLTSYTIRLNFNREPHLINLQRSSYGRPFLPQHENFDFNVSHNGDFTILVACESFNVGTDVMKLELPPLEVTVCRFISKMRSLFSVREFEYFNRVASEYEKMRTFFRLWCLKEAYVKALGVGLRVELSLIDFYLENTAITCKVSGVALDKWYFEEHLLPNHHIVAIAVKSQDGDTFPTGGEFEILTFEKILEKVSPWNEASKNLWLEFLSKESLPPSMRRNF